MKMCVIYVLNFVVEVKFKKIFIYFVMFSLDNSIFRNNLSRNFKIIE